MTNRDDKAPPGDYVLRVTGGPAAGNEFPLTSARMTLGRAATADIALPDNVISRLHTTVYFHDNKWYIKDLESTNGTWVKGERLKAPRPLALKTPVRIGNTLFEIYHPERADAGLDEALISYRMRPVTVETLSGTASAVKAQQDQHKLAAIYKLQRSLSSTHGDELYDRILEVVSEVIPADSAYLLIYRADDDILTPVAERNREGKVDPVTDSYLSRSIVNYVKERNEGILSSDASHDVRFHSDSLSGLNVRSVICVPILGTRKLCGLIYLSTMKSNRDYEEEDLQLLATVSHSAALTIENRRLIDENLKAERMAAIGMTAASLSHYVKNILGGLEGSVSLLRMGMDSEDMEMMNDAWDILNKNHRRLSSLMLDLLNLSREDSLEFGVCSVATIVKETADLVRAQTQEDKITVQVDESVGKDEYIAEVDNRGIHRVVLNLLNNAADAVKDKHQDSGEGIIWVGCALDSRGQTVEIIVRDNGAGIDVPDIDRVFDMFHTTKGEHGTGLGLAVSKRIVESHGGIIEVDSEKGKGTSFKVKIPCRQQTTNTGYIRNIYDSL